jgi:hypothetical protein
MITKTINVSFTSNYELGCHRICYTIQQPGLSSSFTCQEVNCTPGSGIQCNASIQLELDDTSCSPVTITGYVQACCQDEQSEEGRVPFEIVYNPENPCYVYDLTCSCGIISFLIIDDGRFYPANQTGLNAGTISNVNGSMFTYGVFVDTNSDGEIVNMYTDYVGCTSTLPVLDFTLTPDEGGTPAIIQVRARCNETSVQNCSNQSGTAFIPPFDLGTSFNLCSDSPININNQYTVSGPLGCCEGCELISIQVPRTISVIFWGIDCNGNPISESLNDITTEFCVKTGHWGYWNQSDYSIPITITNLGSC